MQFVLVFGLKRVLFAKLVTQIGYSAVGQISVNITDQSKNLMYKSMIPTELSYACIYAGIFIYKVGK